KFDGLAKNVVFKSPDFDGFKAIGTFSDSLILSNAGGINTSSYFYNNLICGGDGRLAMAFTPLAVVFNTSVFKLGANVYTTFFSTCTNSTIYFEGGAGSSILNNSFGLT